MRAGRFGQRFGRAAIVVALVAGVFVAGTSVASAAELTGDTSASVVGEQVQSSIDTIVQTLDTDWS